MGKEFGVAERCREPNENIVVVKGELLELNLCDILSRSLLV